MKRPTLFRPAKNRRAAPDSGRNERVAPAAGPRQPADDVGEPAPPAAGAASPYPPGLPPSDGGQGRAEPVAQRGLETQPAGSIAMASQWKLMWWRFRKNRLALVGAATVILIYLVAIFGEFLAPFAPTDYKAQYAYAPPQRLHLFDTGDGFRFRPYVNGYTSEINPVSLQRRFIASADKKVPLRLFARGPEYKLLGLIPANIHLIGPVNPADPMYLLGADNRGRDMLSRLIYGARISMSIGLVGVFLSLALGILFGGISGYYSGSVDLTLQRIIEFLTALPTLPLWMGLSAAMPPTWGGLQVYFGMTVILSLISWTGMARVVRGRFLSLREEDFVMAARLDGASELRIILRYLVPSFTSHIIATLTLAIPNVILAETALSFLGLGLRPPIISWGVLLQDAQNVRAIATAPWLLTPALAVMVVVMAFYFLGDGLRDAADPYAV